MKKIVIRTLAVALVLGQVGVISPVKADVDIDFDGQRFCAMRALVSEDTLVDDKSELSSSQQLVFNQQVAALEQAYKRANPKTYADYLEQGVDVLKAVAVKSLTFIKDRALDFAKWTGRWVGSYLASYYAEDLVIESLAGSASLLAGVISGPAASATVYSAIKSVAQAAKWIPGGQGALAAVTTPYTKTFLVDPIIEYGPLVAKKASAVSKVAANAAVQASENAWGYLSSGFSKVSQVFA